MSPTSSNQDGSEPSRPHFASRFGVLATMIGVAVGLGNVWRFPYMVGQFGGATFVLVYTLAVLLIGVPAMAAEWALGRATRRGPVGAFGRAGLPWGKAVGWGLFFGVTCATGYYANALGWVLCHAVAQLGALAGLELPAAAILPPATGFDPRSFLLQAGFTALVIAGCAGVLVAGLRRGTERASKVLVPALLLSLLLLIGRGLTLPGAWEGVRWYLLDVDAVAFRPSVVAAAFGQAFFSLSLGGTFMVVYGSYLSSRERLWSGALATALGDLGAGLLAGLAILPAVIALGLAPSSGPGLIFSTLPEVYSRIPGGAVFGALFFLTLFGAAFLSAVAAFEVLVAGLVDNLRLTRSRAVAILAGVVFAAALPPMVNLEIFVPWDLTFGSGLQTTGALLAVITLAWSLDRGEALRQLAPGGGWRQYLLVFWLRWVVPAVVLALGLWWLFTEVLGVLPAPG
ncbi:MAG: sodium-dependent transporter [Holophagales bacterium]|nr:sodium-dependent transporter [Holophagales bacterium]